MDLIFVSVPGFDMGEEISERVREYFPNLISGTKVVELEDYYPRYHFFDNLTPNLEKEINPDWKKDIVLNVVLGPVYWADMELPSHAYGMDTLDSEYKPTSKTPKIGGHFIISNIPMNLREENYLSKVGVEEILHYFKTPESHGDYICFFHNVENKYEDYCQECRDLMMSLKEPLKW